MKKLPLLILLLLATSFAHAQLQGGDDFVGAVRLGNSFALSPNNDYSLGIGFHFGFVRRLKITKSFAFQPELLSNLIYFSSKEQMEYYDEENDSYYYDSTSKRWTTYLSLPLMFEANILPRLSVEAGPQVSWLVLGALPGVKHVDFSLNLGVGYYIPDITSDIFIRYSRGLNNQLSGASLLDKKTNHIIQVGFVCWF